MTACGGGGGGGGGDPTQGNNGGGGSGGYLTDRTVMFNTNTLYIKIPGGGGGGADCGDTENASNGGYYSGEVVAVRAGQTHLAVQLVQEAVEQGAWILHPFTY